MALRQCQEIIVVAAHSERGPAVTGIVQSGDGRQSLREESLLHLTGNLNLTIQALALCDLIRDSAHEVCVLEGESGLCRQRLEQPHIRTGVRLFRFFRTQRDEAQQLVAHRQGQQQLGAQAGQLAALFLRDIFFPVEP